MNYDRDDSVKWNAKHDAFRSTTDFSDLLKIVACYYEMYSRAVTFLGPWIAKQQGNLFIPPDREDIKAALGKERAAMSFGARSAFIESVIQYVSRSRGSKTLITPNPSSHHSAQFPAGSFQISPVSAPPILRDDRGLRPTAAAVFQIDFFGASEPVFIENLRIPPDQIQFIIVRPKLGKLGTASANRWEVLLYKNAHAYLVDHVDSHLNPRWAGIY